MDLKYLKSCNKKSFTLMELVIVIVLVSIMYYFVLSNNFESDNKRKEGLSLINLKSYLLSFDFKNSASIKCIESDDYDCYVFLDNKLEKDLSIKNLFKDKPSIYEYTKEQDRMEFGNLKLDTFEEFNVVFEYSIGADMKSKDFILDTGEKIYVFNSIYNKPIQLKYLYEVLDSFENRVSEVKDVF